jgi:hypothetical protein
VAADFSLPVERTEARIEQPRCGRVQDEDLDLPRRPVGLEEVDSAVARHYGSEPVALTAHGHGTGAAKAVAVELACRLADSNGRRTGGHYGVGSRAVSAAHRQVANGWQGFVVNSSVVNRFVVKQRC